MSVWFKSRLNPWYIWIPSNPNLYSTKIIMKMRWQTIASNVSIRTISPTTTPLPKAYDCVAVYIAGRRTSLVVYGWWPQPPTKKDWIFLITLSYSWMFHINLAYEMSNILSTIFFQYHQTLHDLLIVGYTVPRRILREKYIPADMFSESGCGKNRPLNIFSASKYLKA